MTDEELAKHCVCGCIYLEAECPNCNKVTDADRIEALVKERDTWQKEALRQSGLMHNVMLGAANAEAKLAKAYDIIARIVAIAPDGDEYDDEWHMTYDAAKELLAELEEK